MTPTGAGLADALLADRYRMAERIAVGGMGEVWRAHDLLLDRVVAVKTLRAEHLADEDFRARFRAEARHAGSLAHPGIASVFDFGEDDDRAFLVMELVDGEPLSTLLHRERVLSVDRTLDLVAQTATALHAAHEGGVVHRDVKPGNLLVRDDGVLKVTDFGIASAADAVPLTQTGEVVGTAYYLSPEQAAGRSGSPLSDVYGLGVVAYECLAGGRPFRGDNAVSVALAHLREQPPELPGSVPAAVRGLVARAMAKDPAQRFPSAQAMADAALALRAALVDGTLSALPGTAPVDGGLAGLPVEPPPGVNAPTGLMVLPLQAERGDVRHPPGSRVRSARSTVRTVLALLVVLALGLGIRTAVAPPATARTTVPEVTRGMTEAAARTLLRDAELEVDRRTRVDALPTGQVLAVEPGPGSSLAAGSEVRLWVSSGQPPVQVDPAAYVGRPAVEVRGELVELGLVPRLAYDGSGTAVGTVSSVEPGGGVAVGDEVVLHVVAEQPPALVPAPAPAAPAPVAPAPVAPAPAAEPEAPDQGPGSGGGPAPGKGGGKGKGKG